MSDMEHVLSSELDFSDALASGRLDGYAVRQVNLSRVNLEYKELSNVTFTKVGLSPGRMAWLTGKDLQFHETSMRSADLSMVHIEHGNFLNCEAIELNCRGALFEETRWFETTMSNANYRQARLLKCHFQSSELYGACFAQAFFSHCSFSDAKMGNASLTRADFRNAMLIDVDLRGANLHAANFSGAILVRVDLRGANLVRADMRGATLVGCSFNPGDLDDAERD